VSEDAENPRTEKLKDIEPDDTPLGALFKAVDKADKMKRVLIIFEKDDDTYGSEDNGITITEALWMIECYKAWMFRMVFRPKDE
jgi:hypothetical protein